MLARMWRKRTLYNVSRNVNIPSGTATMKNSMRFLKKLKIELPYDPAIPYLGIYPKKNKNTNSKRYMHPNIQSSIIYNCQDIEAT